MKKRIALILICLFLLSIAFFALSFAKDFSDVPETHWAYEYVNNLSNKGIINGYEDGSFKPGGTITRAEFIKLIVSTSPDVLELTETIIENESIEVKNWFDKYVAAAGGVMDALPREYTDEELNKPITRLEVAYILNQFCNFRGLNKKAEASSSIINQGYYTETLRKYAKENNYIIDDKLTDEEFYDEFSSLSDEQREKIINDFYENEDMFSISVEEYEYLKQVMIEKGYISNSNPTDEEVGKAFDNLTDEEQLKLKSMVEENSKEMSQNQSYDEIWAIYETGKEVMLDEGYIQSLDITEEEFVQVLDSMGEIESMLFKQTVAEKYYKQISQVFNDISSLSVNELAAIVNIKDYGIINGYEDGSFKPFNNMTRAEASTVIYRFLTTVEEGV